MRCSNFDQGTLYLHSLPLSCSVRTACCNNQYRRPPEKKKKKKKLVFEFCLLQAMTQSLLAAQHMATKPKLLGYLKYLLQVVVLMVRTQVLASCCVDVLLLLAS
jgi:hypothetical protein